ncbi:MAG: pyruvate kinase [Cyanobacteria bacterium J06597_1]
MHWSDSFRRTKIVATIGPATSKPDVLRQLVLNGATTLRLNFSHGSHDDHRRSIRLIRQVAYELGIQVGILQDLQGPKIRLGKFADGAITLEAGDPYVLTSTLMAGTQERSCITYDRLAKEVPEGSTILIDDGRVEMRVERVDPDAGELHCHTVIGGVLSNSKGVNFPGVRLSIRAITEKDRADLKFGLSQGVDWVALSFVREPSDVIELRQLMSEAGYRVPIVVKFEKHEAVEQMEEILSLCDGVMVARGDLGVEVPAEDVPVLQKKLIATANRLGIPVITATQMLDSMAHSPRATRAEISDVANAILDGTDAVMLSNETAVGNYPVEAVATMASIARRIEKEYVAPARQLPHPPRRHTSDNVYTPKANIPDAISRSVGKISQQLHAAAIMSLTRSGATARNVSKFRPHTPILAITPQVNVARQLQMVWGVHPLVLADSSSTKQTFDVALNSSREQGLLEDGDLVVMTAGTIQGISGSTDLIKVEVVKSVVATGQGYGRGCVSGPARIVRSGQESSKLVHGEILVAPATDANYVEAMKHAAGVVTEASGAGSHAAVIATRLGLPVMVGVSNATDIIRDGAIVTLDPENGIITSGSISDDDGMELP